MPKIVAYTALHYGKSYLASAIRSVIDTVDEWWILYSDVGSHGTRTDIPCPDTREELLAIAQAAAGSKLGWVDGRWGRETDQRSMIHELAPDADVILVVDSDEIWPDGLASRIVADYEKQANWYGVIRHLQIPMIHYWRSFYRAIVHDPAAPVRVIFPKVEQGNGSLAARINHFGYAQPPDIIRYKLQTHGHIHEFRRDVDWFNDVFMANRQTDCHPIGSEWWNPETVNPWDYLPVWMQEHPFANLEVIE